MHAWLEGERIGMEWGRERARKGVGEGEGRAEGRGRARRKSREGGSKHLTYPSDLPLRG